MKIQQKEQYGAVILELNGKLTGGPESETFRNIFKTLIDEDEKNVIVNLRKVDWINRVFHWVIVHTMKPHQTMFYSYY